MKALTFDTGSSGALDLAGVELGCNEKWISFPHNDKSFAISRHNALKEKPMLFSGHKLPVSALCFGNEEDTVILGSGSQDCVIVWYFSKTSNFEDSFCRQIKNVTIAKDLGYVQHISFSNSDDMISIAVGHEVWLIVIETCELNVVIKSHLAPVTASKFCPSQSNLLVTISEDRTYMVWDVDEKITLYQSPIISAYPFLTLAFHPSQKEVSIGSADGMVRVFTLEERFNCIHTIDLKKLFTKNQQDKRKNNPNDGKCLKTVSSPVTSRQADELETLSTENEEEPGLSVLGLFYSKITTLAEKNEVDDNHEDDYHVTRDLLKETSVLICGTSNAIIVLNINTCHLIRVFDFRDPISVANDLDISESSLVSLSGSCVFTQDKLQKDKVICFLGSLFQNTLHIVHVFLSRDGRDLAGKTDLAEYISPKNLKIQRSSTDEDELLEDTSVLQTFDYPAISILSKAPLSENSPLRAELIPKTQENPVKSNVKKQEKTVRKKTAIENQPVTFKSKIKSSGYTSTPRSKMFSPKVNSPKQTKPAQFTQKSTALLKDTKSLVDGESQEYNIPIELNDKISLCSAPVAINQIAFSSNGKQLACALSNQTAHVLNIPQTTKQRVYSGHNGVVHSVNFSHDGQLLLTSSKDNTACVWGNGNNSEPILTFTNQKHSITTGMKDNPNFLKGINDAKFYYLDKFILLSSGNTLFLYKYYLDSTKDDLKRYQSKSHYKLVTCFPLQKAQNIAHFACINGFYSYIVLCAGSDRSLEVFDLNVGQRLLKIEDIHSRNAHCIKLNEGSKNFSLPSQTYDLFLTAAISDGVKLWDLRANRCVRKYEGHVNRSHPVGVSWSPCSKYFAVGSEDKSAYIYDVRQSKPYHRLTRHTDVVYDVAFHPANSQLVTASFDGKLHFYSDKI